MTFFWLVMAALALLALIFVAWPFVKYRNNSDSAAAIAMQPEARLAENVALFKEHLAELEAQLRDERIEQAQYEQLKHELQRSLLDDEADIRARSQGSSKGASWGIFVLIAALLLVGAFALYEHLGSRADVQIEALQAKKQYDDYQQMLAGRAPNSTLALELAQVIEARLASDPESVQYWFILARTYMEVNDFAKAAAAYSQVLKRDQESGMVMAEAAQAIFLRDGNQVSFPVENLAKTALKLEPQNTMALGLMGIVAFNKKQYSAAIQYWQQATAILGDSSSGSASLKTGIERALSLIHI